MPSNISSSVAPSPLALNLSKHQGLFQWVSSSHQLAKNCSFGISPFNEYSGLISFRIDWFDLLASQETLKSLLQHHSSKPSVPWGSAFFMAQLSHLYMTTKKKKRHSFDYMDLNWQVMCLLFNTLSRFVIAFLPRSRKWKSLSCVWFFATPQTV